MLDRTTMDLYKVFSQVLDYSDKYSISQKLGLEFAPVFGFDTYVHILESDSQWYHQFLKDYPVVEAWLKYLQFLEDSQETVSFDLFESALECCRSDLGQLKLLFNSFLDLIPQTEHSAMYLKMIAVPHIDLEETWTDYCSLVEGEILKDVYGAYLLAKTVLHRLERVEYAIIQDRSNVRNWEQLLLLSSQKRAILHRCYMSLARTESVGLWRKYLRPEWAVEGIARFPNEPYMWNQYFIASDKNVVVENLVFFNDLQTHSDWTEMVRVLLIKYTAEKFVDSEKVYDNFFEIALKQSNIYHTIERLVIKILVSNGQKNLASKYLLALLDNSIAQAEIWLLTLEHSVALNISFHLLYKKIRHVASSIDWPQRVFDEWLSVELQANGFTNYHKLSLLYQLVSQDLQKNNKRKIEEVEIDQPTDEIEIDQPAEDKKLTPRDREHLSVQVKNLSDGVNENDIVRFFSDCGVPRNILIKDNTAVIEFTSQEQVLASLTKDHHFIQGQEITVQLFSNNSVFVTNFPPTETQESLKLLFEAVGSVISIRFPSLKFNPNRRFCYVTYLNNETAAKAADRLNNHIMGDYKLQVRISDPENKQKRAPDAIDQEREIYIKNLGFDVTKDKLNKLFEKYGAIEKVSLPLSFKNKQLKRHCDGFAFITFEDAKAALEAVQEISMTDFEGRIIEVLIATKQKNNNRKVVENFTKINPEHIAQRTISILNLPDTISHSQLLNLLETKVGHVNKLDLSSKNNCALVEFAKLEDAGRADLTLNGETVNNQIIQIGARKDFDNKINIKSKLMVPTSVRRKPRMKKN